MSISSPVYARSFDLGRTMGRAFSILGQELVVAGGVGLIMSLAIGVIEVGVLAAAVGGSGAGANAPAMIGLSATVGLVAVVMMLLQVGFIHAIVAQAAVDRAQGKPLTFGAAWGVGLRNMLPVSAVLFIVAVCAGIGGLFFIIPGVLIRIVWYVSAPAMVAERTGVFEALSRARTLSRNNRGALFGFMFLFGLILGVAIVVGFSIVTMVGLTGVVAGGADQLGGVPTAAASVASAISSILYLVFFQAFIILASAGSTAAYMELIEVKGGGSKQQLAQVFE